MKKSPSEKKNIHTKPGYSNTAKPMTPDRGSITQDPETANLDNKKGPNYSVEDPSYRPKTKAKPRVDTGLAGVRRSDNTGTRVKNQLAVQQSEANLKPRLAHQKSDKSTPNLHKQLPKQPGLTSNHPRGTPASFNTKIADLTKPSPYKTKYISKNRDLGPIDTKLAKKNEKQNDEYTFNPYSPLNKKVTKGLEIKTDDPQTPSTKHVDLSKQNISGKFFGS
jgi:hypothetical protein